MKVNAHFDHEFFYSLRRRKATLAESNSIERVTRMLESLKREGEQDNLVDLDSVISRLVTLDAIKNPEDTKYQINDLVRHVEALTPEHKQLKPGMYVAIGKTEAGKTRWIRELIANDKIFDNSILLSHDEPKLSTDLIGTSRGLEELIECFEVIAQNPGLNVICIDGIRTIQYESTGTTLNGGVKSGFFRFLTDVGNAAVEAGIVLICTYNPNTEKDETYEVVAAMTDGSVQGIIDLNQKVIRSRYHKRASYPLADSMSILFDDTPDAAELENLNNNAVDLTEL